MSLIELQNISKKYSLGQHSVEALKDINVSINQGDFLGIFGQSGSGKSTLLNIIGILDKQTGGNYIFEQENINKLSNKEMATHRCHNVGIIFQSFNLFPELSIFENIAIPMHYANKKKSEIKETVERLAAKVQLGNRLKHRPNQLSGGQRQRVAIARSLANDPSIILADEPTGNLDESTGEVIIEIFQELIKEKKTVIMVTHNDSYTEIVSRYIKIKDGKIIHET